MSEPKVLELEEAIKEFHNLAKEFAQVPNLTAEVVLARVLKLYRETRIVDTELDDDDDMLLLQWGIINPFTADTPYDLRNKDIRVQFDEKEYQYMDFTRQIYQSLGLVEDVDTDMIQMRITLLYGEATGDEKSSNLWISCPNHIETELERNYENDFVKQHLTMPVTRLCAHVDYCG